MGEEGENEACVQHIFLFLKITLLIFILFLAVLGLRCRAGSSLVVVSMAGL